MVPYQHTSLLFADSIRLVRICPERDQTEQLQLSIQLIRLQNAPKYKALSYEWGNMMHDEPILCDGQELHVQANLAAVLKRLWKAENPPWLWIDAICIDQGNIPERNQQVSMMRDIYAQAEQVLAWIGDEIALSKEVFDVIPILARLWQAREVVRLKAGDERPPVQIELSIAERASLPSQDHPLWRSLFMLYSSTYFQRTWIIQEIVVSTQAIVLCGALQVSWKLFHWGASFINTTTSLLHQAPENRSLGSIMAIAGIQQKLQPGDNDPLAFYLQIVQASKSSDPRDKVFGVLGLGYGTNKPLPPSDLSHTLLHVDYNKSVQEVYRDAAKYIILSQRHLRIYCGQPLTGKSVEGLPSWVPDWSERIDGAPAPFLVTQSEVHSMLPGKITFDSDDSMFVDGLILDTVNFTTGTMSCEAPLPDIQQIIFHLGKRLRVVDTSCVVGPGHQFLEMVGRLGGSAYKTGGSIFDALWRTLIGNIANFQPAQPDFERHFWGIIDIIVLRERGIVFDRHDWNQEVKLDPQMATKLQNDAVAQCYWKSAQACQSHYYFAELVNTIQGRVFFTTAQGYMGFGAMGTKVGDKVCILGGGWTPFILRRHKTYFEMIGDAYLHGAMQGGMLNLVRSVVKRFRIC